MLCSPDVIFVSAMCLPTSPVFFLQEATDRDALIKFNSQSSSHSHNNKSNKKLPERPKPPQPQTKTLMDQSIENNFPVIELTPSKAADSANDNTTSAIDGFFQMHQSEPKPVSKPSALQRIYAQKAKREEDNPEKYKHRLDCYIDKDKDKRFWQTPGEGEPEDEVHSQSKRGKGAASKQKVRILSY